MELKEYYTEKGVKDSNSPQGPDSWAIKHISISRARSILEAFDDDFSGFVTVNEVNNLIRSKPQDWRCALRSPPYNLFSKICVVFPTGQRTGQQVITNGHPKPGD